MAWHPGNVIRLGLRHGRGMAGQAALANKDSSGMQTKVTTLSNGLTVVSLNSGVSPQPCTVGVAVGAGSRHENYDNAGAGHVLRMGFGDSTTGQFDKVSVAKTLQHLGANPKCVNNREHIFFSVSPPRDTLDHVIDQFLDASTNQQFKRWELMRQWPRLDRDMILTPDQTKVSDLLHRAAFRDTGLGKALVCQPHMFRRHTDVMMRQFYEETFVTGNAALVGVGVQHNVLEGYAELVKLNQGKAPSAPKSPYIGGELRQDTSSGSASVILANQIGGWNNIKEACAAMVLEKILDGCNEGMGESSPLCDAVNGVDVKVKPFCNIYSDIGLFGIQLEAPGNQAGKVVESAAAFLRSLSLTEEQVNLGKQRTVSYAYDFVTDPLVMADDAGVQALMTKQVMDASQAQALIQQTTLGDVQAIAKKLGSGKLSMAALGNLKTVPYLDSL